ncbi:MAG TPA: peptidylprolyl isomerase [Candidatus Binatia bacterium]|nr:peptidylprolyl isomerase [Candidatus Binatia bacterium]
MSGAVLGALFFLTHFAANRGSRDIQALTLTQGQVVQEGALVSIEYTLTDERGEVLESTIGKPPMTYVHGIGQVVPGLEKELTGLKIGARKKIRVEPQDGYGPADPKAFHEIPRDKIPPEAQKPGAMLMTKDTQGQSITMRVHEVKEKTIVVDFNHPLAGKTLNFEVKVVDIQAASMPR